MIRNTGYLQSSNNDLFVLQQLPTRVSESRIPVVLVLQPLFEELNMTRRYINSICSELASRGYATILFDLSCTGDSTGDCEEANWSTWIEDVNTVCRALTKQNYSDYYLLAVRGGCLLINEIESDLNINFDGCVVLEPETSGSRLVTRLLRLRAYSSGFGNRRAERVSDLRARINSGETLEIGGTLISAELFQRLEVATFSTENSAVCSRSQIINIDDTPLCDARESSSIDTQCVHPLECNGRYIAQGPSFWTSIEYQIDTDRVSTLVGEFRFISENQ